MALRFTYLGLALALFIVSGCRSSSNYRPGCCSKGAVVTPPPASCPTPCPTPIPGPPPFQPR